MALYGKGIKKDHERKSSGPSNRGMKATNQKSVHGNEWE
jgi:hypothetical protein